MARQFGCAARSARVASTPSGEKHRHGGSIRPRRGDEPCDSRQLDHRPGRQRWALKTPSLPSTLAIGSPGSEKRSLRGRALFGRALRREEPGQQPVSCWSRSFVASPTRSIARRAPPRSPPPSARSARAVSARPRPSSSLNSRLRVAPVSRCAPRSPLLASCPIGPSVHGQEHPRHQRRHS